MKLFSLFEHFAAKHAKSCAKRFNYGTAGFRDNWTQLDSIVFRMGALAAVRSLDKNGSAVGLMITASHNPEDDNGVKIIDSCGEMLESSWEAIASDIANSENEHLYAKFADLINDKELNQRTALVFIARDTRKSSLELANAAIDGVRAIGGEYTDFCLLTTPQLHFIVHCFNTNGSYGEPSEEGYYKKLSQAFSKINSIPPSNHNLVVDCANGVGAEKIKKLTDYIDKKFFNPELCNIGNGILNYKCGADFVKLNQLPPEGVELKANTRYASFDGDADRIVYYFLDLSTSKFCLMDGDKIAVLFMSYLKELLDKMHLADELDFCVVQTAYANGNSTDYIRNVLKVETACVPTGVKHLHSRAQQSDIAVYFEANGHGTALISNKAENKIKQSMDSEVKQHLLNFIDLINQTNGDAISDLLVVETILNNRQISINDWSKFYNDLPNRQLKVSVTNKNAIKTTFDETRCVAPDGLQNAINEVVQKFGTKARSFVRPSGTEDIVRVYAEAQTQEQANLLAQEVAAVVEKMI
ncbi:phosphoacetylglucosamine mutase-like protein [Dinothrombium tinctorium]|uniref:Phosphoacetylglucosamine mutase n=1 Tax=Dinothrombium tinctorium TaxID=1965070 RepID=A0A3S3P242_9ACAR|nr:phosphoacetylglucosamine mutase-like protein [Dinothrombium tinctorium]RWS11451.1 phosphoacetylglucosamine mutase-like protein [Dinothrombium tinctorium]